MEFNKWLELNRSKALGFQLLKLWIFATQEGLKWTCKKKYNIYAFNVTNIIANPLKIDLQQEVDSKFIDSQMKMMKRMKITSFMGQNMRIAFRWV